MHANEQIKRSFGEQSSDFILGYRDGYRYADVTATRGDLIVDGIYVGPLGWEDRKSSQYKIGWVSGASDGIYNYQSKLLDKIYYRVIGLLIFMATIILPGCMLLFTFTFSHASITGFHIFGISFEY